MATPLPHHHKSIGMRHISTTLSLHKGIAANEGMSHQQNYICRTPQSHHRETRTLEGRPHYIGHIFAIPSPQREGKKSECGKVKEYLIYKLKHKLMKRFFKGENDLDLKNVKPSSHYS